MLSSGSGGVSPISPSAVQCRFCTVTEQLIALSQRGVRAGCCHRDLVAGVSLHLHDKCLTDLKHNLHRKRLTSSTCHQQVNQKLARRPISHVPVFSRYTVSRSRAVCIDDLTSLVLKCIQSSRKMYLLPCASLIPYLLHQNSPSQGDQSCLICPASKTIFVVDQDSSSSQSDK